MITCRKMKTRDHIIWMLKLDFDQLEVLKDLLRNIYSDEYWFGVNKFNIRHLVDSWVENIEDAKFKSPAGKERKK